MEEENHVEVNWEEKCIWGENVDLLAAGPLEKGGEKEKNQPGGGKEL